MFNPKPTSLPRPANPVRAAELRQEWLAAANEFGPEDAAFVRKQANDPVAAPVLEAIFGNSPFLTRLVFAHPEIVRIFMEQGAGPAVVYAGAAIQHPASTEAGDLPRMLRQAKARTALAVALADLTDAWTLAQVVTALSTFADACVRTAVETLLHVAHGDGRIRLADPKNPMGDCGYFVLAMGKLGANELNYSSDIDLIVLFDPKRLPYIGTKSPQEFAVNLTKDLVQILQERTGDGYVFRTDLRLRPDPGSTTIALSREAARIYYESYGQNWERAAMIKARYVAGDRVAADEFLRDLQPFLWRKSLDFYALQDIHSIKRQIYAYRGGGVIQVPGHNIKLGRGGIREIEFFVQTQQLIWGGRLPDTRAPQTLEALDALTQRGFVAASVRDDLAAAYRFLRHLEHRLQMVADEQTQSLPADPAKLAAIATFAGYDDRAQFEADVAAALRTVEAHYAALFEDAPSLAIEGNLVFTGTDDDPDTMATLRRLGFTDPSAVAAAVRAWHRGRYRATRSDRARQLLTEIMPSLLTAFGKTAQPDAAFLRFDQCLAEQQSGVQLLSVFQANPHLLDLVAEIMGDAPRLADHLARNPALLDYVLEPDFYGAISNLAGMRTDLDRSLAAADSYESTLDLCRRWANDQRFRIGVQTLRGLITPHQAARNFSDVAEAVLVGLVPRVALEFENQFGRVADGTLALLAYGKLGSGELTPTSDLDLVVIYNGPADGRSQGGPRSLPMQAYYMRFVQRLITALTLLTREGVLYNVDLRLRPSGQQGPLACSLEAFAKYQRENAWTWEHMALTRARVVQGAPELATQIEQTVHEILVGRREPAVLLAEVADMRARMRKEHTRTDQDPWSLKHRPGGLIDGEFIVQYLLLGNNSAIPAPGSDAHLNAQAAIERLAKAGALPQTAADTLSKGLALWSSLQVMLRLTLGDDTPATLPLGLKTKLVAVTGAKDFPDLQKIMRQTSADIYALFQDMIELPAAALDRTPSGTAS
ncbi:MAG: bifunctional [glutamine synthetase] adenylyltransferase/[glutamine synthetase]-adenylyl-L-tyrosine phosphorylase [Rhodospirillaceae bacterium]|nr:MAG: bifunctional [glutamine synthetase] adenylyltransferase/[glutamine synthetase]-adenylyl-L-tyrosine phosphorylase [Rhodospirillaceae bacterium]